MNQYPRVILLEVLSIIEYPDNKEETADKFLKLCQDRAVINMIDALRQQEKQELHQKLFKIKDETSLEYMLIARQYFTIQGYLDATKKASEKVFAEYLSTIMPTLTNEQQDKLLAYLGSLSS